MLHLLLESSDPDKGVDPGTVWEDVPNDWICPICGPPRAILKNNKDCDYGNY
ncbi:rubredoxin [Desulfosediminicola sp.]|uniref:rubredoxin n=1 Tax=Desulfosediminicola sp. TaxID=2886825 RepID=UPI003AF1FE40